MCVSRCARSLRRASGLFSGLEGPQGPGPQLSTAAVLDCGQGPMPALHGGRGLGGYGADTRRYFWFYIANTDTLDRRWWVNHKQRYIWYCFTRAFGILCDASALHPRRAGTRPRPARTNTNAHARTYSRALTLSHPHTRTRARAHTHTTRSRAR